MGLLRMGLLMMDGCWWVVTGYMASVLTITEVKGSAKFLIKKNIVEPMVLVPRQPKQKSAFTPRVITEAKRHPLLVSPQYASVLKPRQNAEHNRGQKPLLHWWLIWNFSPIILEMVKKGFISFNNWSLVSYLKICEVNLSYFYLHSFIT